MTRNALYSDDGLAPARGAMNGILLGLGCWAVIGVVVYWVWRMMK